MNDFSLDFPRGKASQRQMKVQEILRAALVEILQRGLTKEPILDNSMITITYVDVSPDLKHAKFIFCLLYTSPSPRDRSLSRMPSSA